MGDIYFYDPIYYNLSYYKGDKISQEWYDKNIDFVVDLDNIWKWLGFSTKQNSERVLEKHFKLDIDYKTAPQVGGATSNDEKLLINLDKQDNTIKLVKQNGGHNKQTILLTIKCFKSLCLKAQTKKAGEIHEYYMKMEDVLHQIVEEETDELRLQLEQKESIILEKDIALKNSKKEKIYMYLSIHKEARPTSLLVFLN